MTKIVRRCGLTDTILNSTLSAYREYLRICDFTMGVAETPEYWYTTAITRAIAKEYAGKNVYPVLEDSLKSIKSLSGSKTKGPTPNALRLNGRTDIALWKYGRKDWRPVSFIEVKKGRKWQDTFEKDIKRIVAALDKLGSSSNGSVEGGFFAIVTDIWGEKGRSEMIKEFNDSFENLSVEIKARIPKGHAMKGYKSYTEYNQENKVMGAAMVFKIK